jgi:hypothetical protein
MLGDAGIFQEVPIFGPWPKTWARPSSKRNTSEGTRPHFSPPHPLRARTLQRVGQGDRHEGECRRQRARSRTGGLGTRLARPPEQAARGARRASQRLYQKTLANCDVIAIDIIGVFSPSEGGVLRGLHDGLDEHLEAAAALPTAKDRGHARLGSTRPEDGLVQPTGSTRLHVELWQPTSGNQHVIIPQR